jgi:hypothetical protein
MATTQTVLPGQDTATQGKLYMSFELGDKSWKLTISDGRRGPSRYSIDAGDTDAISARSALLSRQGEVWSQPEEISHLGHNE